MILAVYVYDVQNLSNLCSSVQHGLGFFDLYLLTALRNGHTMQNGSVKGGVFTFLQLQRNNFSHCGILGYLNYRRKMWTSNMEPVGTKSQRALLAFLFRIE